MTSDGRNHASKKEVTLSKYFSVTAEEFREGFYEIESSTESSTILSVFEELPIYRSPLVKADPQGSSLV